MLKNSCKATRFYSDTHDCNLNLKNILDKGWLAKLKVCKESLAGFFQQISLLKYKKISQLIYKLYILRKVYLNGNS
jgi:hypothetical protein